MKFPLLCYTTNAVVPIRSSYNEKKLLELSDDCTRFVEEVEQEENETDIIPETIKSISNLSMDDYSIVTTNTEPPNIIIDQLTPCELILYNEMVNLNVSSITIKHRISTYYKETMIVTIFPPICQWKHFGGKNITISLMVMDECFIKYRFQDYLKNYDGDLTKHNFIEYNHLKKKLCEKLRVAYDANPK